MDKIFTSFMQDQENILFHSKEDLGKKLVFIPEKYQKIIEKDKEIQNIREKFQLFQAEEFNKNLDTLDFLKLLNTKLDKVEAVTMEKNVEEMKKMID